MHTAFRTSGSLQYLGQFSSLPLSAPADLVKVLGCLCVTEFIAFYPNDSGNAMVYDNGLWEDHIDTELWSAWATQRHVAGYLKNIDFSTNSCITNALIINVTSRDLYEADEALAQEFLYRHYIDSKGLPRIL